MKSWDTGTLDVEPHMPHVLATSDDARVIVLNLPAGEQLQEHEVHERAWLVVIDGSVEVTTAGDAGRIEGGPGLLVEFTAQERREVTARANARLLLLLTPWPGAGHPGAMTLEQKGDARRHAADHREQRA